MHQSGRTTENGYDHQHTFAGLPPGLWTMHTQDA